MVLAHRQWGWGTRGYPNPWAAHFTSGETTDNMFTEHFATTPIETSTHSTTTLVPAAAAQTTDSSSQVQTSTEPAEAQTTANTIPTTSSTSSPVPVGGESTSRSTSERGATQSSGMSTSGVVVPSLSGGLTVSLPDTASADQSTASGSSSTAQPVATGSNGHPTSSNSGHGIGKGAIAAIALGIVFALGLGGLIYYCWKRRGGRRCNSTFIQYPFSSDAATRTMSEAPNAGALVPTNTPAEWETMAESPSATLTFASPTATGASGYGYDGGLATYPLDEKSPLPSPSDNNPFDPATAPSPRSATAFALSFPMPPSPLSSPELSRSLVVPPPPAAHPSLPEGEPSAMPYAWDRPPPSSEYLPPRTPDRRSTFRSSRTGSGPSPRRASAATVAATPIYSSGVPEVDRRPPSYSRY